MPNELAPCPFCGASGAELVTYHEPGTVLHPWYRVECDHCGAKGPGTDRGTHREDWNRRAAATAPASRGMSYADRIANRLAQWKNWRPITDAIAIAAEADAEIAAITATTNEAAAQPITTVMGLPVYEAALAASAPSQAEPTHRHIKRGTTYTERARGRLQVDEGVILRDMCPLVAYQSTDDGEWWFRPVADFDNPRRFEKVAPSQAGSCQASGDSVSWRDVVSAITAAQADNARRGGMFPQEADEHARDAAAVVRIAGLLTWYGEAAYKLAAWPKNPAPPAGRTLTVLQRLVGVIDSAGLLNLSSGVQLGQHSWLDKATNAMNDARAILAASSTTAGERDHG